MLTIDRVVQLAIVVTGTPRSAGRLEMLGHCSAGDWQACPANKLWGISPSLPIGRGITVSVSSLPAEG